MVEPLKARAISRDPKSGYLEFGTSRMAARPFMYPAAAREREAVIDMITQAVADILDRTVSITGGSDETSQADAGL
jgi:hypothetical protein